jgi:DNA-binding phage protein
MKKNLDALNREFLAKLKGIVEAARGEAAAAARLEVSFYTVARWLRGGGPSPIGRARVAAVAEELGRKK